MENQENQTFEYTVQSLRANSTQWFDIEDATYENEESAWEWYHALKSMYEKTGKTIQLRVIVRITEEYELHEESETKQENQETSTKG